MGESQQTGQGKFGDAIGTDWEDVFIAYLLAKPYVAMRVEDIWAVAAFAKQHAGVERVDLVSIGHPGVPALHAAALSPDTFASLRIGNSLVSWSNVVEFGITQDQLHNAVHGALPWYDLPDLARLIGNKLIIINPVDALGQPV
jgi:hypothetical protein